MATKGNVSERARSVEGLRLACKVLALAGIAALIPSVILFFAAHTGEYVPDANVGGVWRLFRFGSATTIVCGLMALGLHLFCHFATKALDRYSETHCPECGYDLGGIIRETKEKRQVEHKLGLSVHGSLYFDTYCPNCKSRRTLRE